MIGGKRAQHRLRFDQRRGRVPHCLLRAEQQPLTLQEVSAIGPAYQPEMDLVPGQIRCELRSTALGQLRGGSIDHYERHIAQLRESGLHCRFLLAPRDLGRNELGCVRGHRKAIAHDQQ